MFQVEKGVEIPKVNRESKVNDVYTSIADTFKSLNLNKEAPESFLVPNEAASSKVLKGRVKKLLTPVLQPGEYYKYKAIVQNGITTGLRIWKIAAEVKETGTGEATTTA